MPCQLSQPNGTIHFELPPCQPQPVGWTVHPDVEPMEVCIMDIFFMMHFVCNIDISGQQ